MQHPSPATAGPVRARYRVAAGLVVFFIVVSPVLEGALHVRARYALAAGLILGLLAGFAPGRRWAALAVVSLAAVCLSLTLVDLIGRSVFNSLVHTRPAAQFIGPWPPFPQVSRFDPNVWYDGTAVGDLASATANPANGDLRRVTYVTDGEGFRNSPPIPTAIDVVLLGDSFANGSTVMQDQTVAVQLQKTGISVYNMGIGAASPWQEYVNFSLEVDRLPIRPGGTVLWLLYTGNDLSDVYGDPDLSHLTLLSPFEQWQVSLGTYRNRSPVYQAVSILNNARAAPVETRDFLNGRRMLFLTPQADAAAMTARQVRHHQNWPLLVATIEGMAALTQQHHLALDVVVLPTKDEVYQWVYQKSDPWTSDPAPSGFSRAVKVLSQRAGLCFYDMKPDLIAESRRAYDRSGATVYWYDDTHWNAEGQAFAAGALLAHICPAGRVNPLCCG